MENKCNCYIEDQELIDYTPLMKPIYKVVSRCRGTKERDECSCGGDEAKCDFYPEKRSAAQARKVAKDFQAEKWIEEFDGCYPDGYPRSRYRHAWCEVEDKTISSVYPYCPYCGKKVTHIKILKDGLEKYRIEHLEKQGYICTT